MPHSLTIAGKTFEVEPRYSAGHVLTDNEARALNQTFYENLRNNFKPRADEGADQSDFDAYAEAYEFGVRQGGSRDPVETEAMSLAREAVKKAIRDQGKNISSYSAKQISEAAGKLVERNPAYREKARERVAEMQALAGNSAESQDDLLGLVGEPEGEVDDAPAADGAEGETAKPARKRKGEATETAGE